MQRCGASGAPIRVTVLVKRARPRGGPSNTPLNGSGSRMVFSRSDLQPVKTYYSTHSGSGTAATRTIVNQVMKIPLRGAVQSQNSKLGAAKEALSGHSSRPFASTAPGCLNSAKGYAKRFHGQNFTPPGQSPAPKERPERRGEFTGDDSYSRGRMVPVSAKPLSDPKEAQASLQRNAEDFLDAVAQWNAGDSGLAKDPPANVLRAAMAFGSARVAVQEGIQHLHGTKARNGHSTVLLAGMLVDSHLWSACLLAQQVLGIESQGGVSNMSSLPFDQSSARGLLPGLLSPKEIARHASAARTHLADSMKKRASLLRPQQMLELAQSAQNLQRARHPLLLTYGRGHPTGPAAPRSDHHTRAAQRAEHQISAAMLALATDQLRVTKSRAEEALSPQCNATTRVNRAAALVRNTRARQPSSGMIPIANAVARQLRLRRRSTSSSGEGRRIRGNEVEDEERKRGRGRGSMDDEGIQLAQAAADASRGLAISVEVLQKAVAARAAPSAPSAPSASSSSSSSSSTPDHSCSALPPPPHRIAHIARAALASARELASACVITMSRAGHGEGMPSAAHLLLSAIDDAARAGAACLCIVGNDQRSSAVVMRGAELRRRHASARSDAAMAVAASRGSAVLRVPDAVRLGMAKLGAPLDGLEMGCHAEQLAMSCRNAMNDAPAVSMPWSTNYIAILVEARSAGQRFGQGTTVSLGNFDEGDAQDGGVGLSQADVLGTLLRPDTWQAQWVFQGEQAQAGWVHQAASFEEAEDAAMDAARASLEVGTGASEQTTAQGTHVQQDFPPTLPTSSEAVHASDVHASDNQMQFRESQSETVGAASSTSSRSSSQNESIEAASRNFSRACEWFLRMREQVQPGPDVASRLNGHTHEYFRALEKAEDRLVAALGALVSQAAAVFPASRPEGSVSQGTSNSISIDSESLHRAAGAMVSRLPGEEAEMCSYAMAVLPIPSSGNSAFSGALPVGSSRLGSSISPSSSSSSFSRPVAREAVLSLAKALADQGFSVRREDVEALKESNEARMGYLAHAAPRDVSSACTEMGKGWARGSSGWAVPAGTPAVNGVPIQVAEEHLRKRGLAPVLSADVEHAGGWAEADDRRADAVRWRQ